MAGKTQVVRLVSQGHGAVFTALVIINLSSVQQICQTLL